MDVLTTTSRALAFAPEVGVLLSSNDEVTLDWVEEFFGPSLLRDQSARGPRIRITSSVAAYETLAEGFPDDAKSRPVFAFDQEMLSFPVWDDDGTIHVDARHRRCMVSVDESGIEITVDPGVHDWRFMIILVVNELIATALRHSQLEIHSSGVESRGRGILFIGPKRAGKTTLSFRLIRSGLCGWIANDRTFVGPDRAGGLVVRGLPSAVRVRMPTVREFPELDAGLSRVDRPYLYSAKELLTKNIPMLPAAEALLSTSAQVAPLFGAEMLASVPVGAVVFPRVDTSLEGWSLETMQEDEVAEGVWANLFGNGSEPRPPTIFEAMDGGRQMPDRTVADQIAAQAPGYRAKLGAGMYEDPDFGNKFVTALMESE